MIQNQKATSASSTRTIHYGKPPPTPRSQSPSSLTHFHMCENKSCLNQLNHQQHSCQKSSFKTEAKILVSNPIASLPPTHITLKLLPEHRLAYKQYCNARRDQGQKRSCSWSEDMDLISKTRVVNQEKKVTKSPFTCIEMISIKNTSPEVKRTLRRGGSFICSERRETRSLRTTPIRTITIRPVEVK